MIFVVLLRNELLKLYKRLAFWVTLIFFAFGFLMAFGESYFRAVGDPNRSFAFPGAWRDIISDGAEANFIFGGVLLVLLIANEFQWRTARQNVIDGLSKHQWFFGKLLLLPVVAVIFLGTRIVIGTIFGILGTDFSALDGAVMSGVHWTAMGAVSLQFLGYGAWALFASLAIRNTGPAMAVYLAYALFFEHLIAAGLVRLNEGLQSVVQFFPVNTFEQLSSWIQFDPTAFERAVQSAIENDRTPPEIWDPTVLWLTASFWTAALVVSSFVWYHKRDL